MRRPLCLVCLLILGMYFLYGQCRPFSFPDYSAMEKKQVELTGKVGQKIYQTDFQGEVVCLVYLTEISGAGALLEAGFSPPEGVRVYVDREPAWGSTIVVKGKLRTYREPSNPGEFDARLYYQTLGLQFDLTKAVILRESVSYDKPREWLWHLRGHLAEQLRHYLTEEDSSVVCTMLLGEKSTLDAQTKDLFKRNGVIHILTVSGLHISILGMGMYRFFRRAFLPVLPAALLSMAVMLAYGAMVGPGASSFRALFMFGMHLLANVCGRTYDLLTALALAAVLLLFQEPLYLYNSGYLFSFASVFAIGAILPQFTTAKWMQGFTSGVVIFLVTFPIHLWFYFEYPFISIFLNLIIIPLMGVLLKGAAFLLFSACLVPFIGETLASLATIPVHWILWLYRLLCRAGDSLSWFNEVVGRPSGLQVFFYYVILLTVWQLWQHRKEFTGGARFAWFCLAVMILAFRPSEGMKVVFLDVGQGDGIYVAAEDGHRYLFDGGSTSRSNIGKNVLVPFLKQEGVGELDCVFLSHPDEDHISGVLEMLEGETELGIRIKAVALPDIADGAREESYRKLEQTALAAGCKVLYLSNGMVLQNGRLTIRCVNPVKGTYIREPNEYSACFLLEQEGFRMLLTGDITGESEQRMWQEIQPYLDSESGFMVWKIAHHGSRFSTPQEFLRDVKPDVAVISCGSDNSYGHPHEELLQRLEATPARIYRTDYHGAITVEVRRGRVRCRSFLE